LWLNRRLICQVYERESAHVLLSKPLENEVGYWSKLHTFWSFKTDESMFKVVLPTYIS